MGAKKKNDVQVLFFFCFFNKKSDSLALDDGVAHLFYALAR
jgi:hypothetical protein